MNHIPSSPSVEENNTTIILKQLAELDDLEENTPLLSDNVVELSQQEWVVNTLTFHQYKVMQLLEEVELSQKEILNMASNLRAKLEHISQFSDKDKPRYGISGDLTTTHCMLKRIEEKCTGLVQLNQRWEVLRDLTEDSDSVSEE